MLMNVCRDTVTFFYLLPTQHMMTNRVPGMKNAPVFRRNTLKTIRCGKIVRVHVRRALKSYIKRLLEVVVDQACGHSSFTGEDIARALTFMPCHSRHAPISSST